ncbi:MAG: thioredoxin family protein [Ignavibacteria bacterium]|nr:thioredoxin family protein [Ignavibacteria bacterium]
MKKIVFGYAFILVFILQTALSLTLSASPRTVLLSKHTKFSLSPQALTLKPGEEATLKLTMTIDAGWYTYGLQPRKDKDGLGPQETIISIAPAKVLVLAGKVKAPKPKQKFDQGFQIDIDYYEGEIVFTVPVKAASNLASGKYTATLTVTSMTCYAEGCLPATDEEIPITVTIKEGIAAQNTVSPADTTTQQAAAIQQPNNQEPTNQTSSSQASSSQAVTGQVSKPQTTESQTEIAQKRSEGIWAFLLFAMGAGASALLTPCVFPMVPITVSFFTKRAEKQRGRGLRDSLVYALGIVFTFTALGFFLSLIFGATGISDFAANPWVNVALALVFILFAFNLFGAFEIPLPNMLLNRMNNAAGSGESVGAVVLMAVTFSITSFTCTVPFVGAALISASTGEWFYPLIGMAGFSSVFALPFVLLALFPSAMQRLPKAGGWMNNVKVVMGFLEIAAAMKFISNSDLVWAWGVLSRDVFLAIWIGCAVMITLYVLGVFRFPHDSEVKSIGTPRAVIALIFASLTFYLIAGLMGKKLGELDAFLPPMDYERIIGKAPNDGSSEKNGASRQSQNNQAFNAHTPETWIQSYEIGLAEAKRTGKPVFVDFTGFTCTNCRWMEANVFPTPEVQALMGSMVKVQLFTDRKQEPYLSHKKRQLEQFGSIELPLYVLLKPDGTVIATKAFTRDRAEFVAFLKKAL